MKKLISILLTIAMIMTCGFGVVAATDLESANCIETLTALDILKGDEDGNLNLNDNITRAEFTAIVTRLLDVESNTKVEEFIDVPTSHWANPVIYTCYNLGIINGYGDGNFGPEDAVTYEQAIKMLVIALGYEPMASQKGGYPTGYLVVANQIGLTKDVVKVEGAADRMTIAQLAYNALDIPLMSQTGFGTNTEYKILNGDNDTTYTTLLTEMDMFKYEGVITATKTIGDCASDIEYEISSINGKYLALPVTAYLDLAEGISADEYFGISSVLYVREIRSGKYEVVSISQGVDSTVIKLDKKDIFNETLSSGELKYYEDSFSTKATTLKLEDNFKVYLNNEIGIFSDASDDAEVLVIDNNDNRKYDMIVIKDYTYGIVDSVDTYRDRITLKGYGRLQFDFEDEDVVNTLVDAEGAAITLDDFSEGDVIAYIKATDDSWYEVINLGHNVVEGVVTEKGEDGVYIDGSEYELYGNHSVNINDEGIFYLTKTGKIFDTEISASVSSNYGYILEVGEATGTFESGYQIKMLTKDGEIKVFDVRDTYEIDSAIATLDDNIKSDADVRLVTYKLDGNKKIKEINSVITSNHSGEYNSNATAINNKLLNDDIVIFNVDVNDIEDAFVTDIDSLVHECEYTVLLGKNIDQEYDVAVIIEGASKIDFTQDVCVLESITTITYDDADAIKVRFYTGNEDAVREIIVPEDVENYDEIKNLKAGALFMYTGSKVVTDIQWIANDFVINSDAETAIEADNDYELVRGTIDVDGIKSTSKGVNVSYNSGEMITIRNSSNAYTYETKGNDKVVITVGDWQAMKEIEGSTFIAIIENGVVSDIITYAN